jgi:succinoglycan biosynthesis transport protein ExoP
MLRYMEAQQQSTPALEAHLLAEASRPLRASSPKAGMVLGIFTVGGVLLGIAIGLLRDLSDRGIRTSRQVWTELQLTCIAVVPRVRSGGVWRRLTTVFSAPVQKLPVVSASRERSVTSMRNAQVSIVMRSTDGDSIAERALSNAAPMDSPRRNIVRTENPIWTVTDAPQSRFTGSFLEIKLAIDTMNRSGKRNQVIGITSTLPNEGKSTVAAALALHMAHAGDRVALADCNLRNRALSSELAPTAASGTLDTMAGPISVSETIWTDPISRLAFLPVGNNSRPIFATDLLRSDRVGKLFQTLREGYEYIIVDLPALASSADVRSAAHLLDAVILVVEWGSTDASVVERALKACSEIDEIMLGVTLNKADMNFLNRPELRS